MTEALRKLLERAKAAGNKALVKDIEKTQKGFGNRGKRKH